MVFGMVRVKSEISVSVSGLFADGCGNSIVFVSCDFNIKECQRLILLAHEKGVTPKIYGLPKVHKVIYRLGLL